MTRCHSEEAVCGRRENLLLAEAGLEILAVQSRDMVDLCKGHQIDRAVIRHIRTAESGGLVFLGSAHVEARNTSPVLLVVVGTSTAFPNIWKKTRCKHCIYCLPMLQSPK